VSFLALVGTELRRFELRRAMRWMLGLGLLIALVVNVVQLSRSAEHLAYTRAIVPGSFPSECVTGTHNGLPVVERRCAEGAGIVREKGPPGPLQEVYVRVPVDRRVQVGRTFEETIRGLGIGLVLYGVLLGSTFLAAEFGAAGLSTQLVFEPRRVRLYVAKATGVFLGAAISAAIILVWCGLLQYIASALRGSTAGVDAGWLGDRATDVLRASAACGMGAVCAMAVASVARRTVVAVGIFFGLVVGTGFLGGVSWGKPFARVSPMNTLFGAAFGRFQGPDDFFGLHTLAGAVNLSLLWVVVLSAIGAWWFHRREIR
jgi:hypothetical protein